MEASDMLRVDFSDGVQNPFGRVGCEERLHEAGVPHQPRKSGEKLDVLRFLARWGKQEEEHLAGIAAGRAVLDLVRRHGDEQEHGVHGGH